MPLKTARSVLISPCNYRRFNFTIPYGEFDRSYFFHEIQLASTSKNPITKLKLSEILRSYPDAQLRIYAFGSDSVSGARSLTISKLLKNSDITQDTNVIETEVYMEKANTIKSKARRLLRIYDHGLNES